MRIIAGTARRLPLKTLDGKDIRPTTDRIKETLFNIIQPGMRDCYFLDLFAGTGQIGLEAVSRGAACAVFVDNSRKACGCIEDNIQFTRFQEETKVLTMEALPALRFLEGKYSFDYIFMDPPYGSNREQDVLAYLADSALTGEEGTVIVEAAVGTDFTYAEEYGFTITREKRYKTNKHVFLQLRGFK